MSENSYVSPCPFCGCAQFRVIPDADEDGPMYYVNCPLCDTNGPLVYSTALKMAVEADAAAAWHRRAPSAPADKAEAVPQKLWLWKNFVDGKPEYWAFDNPYPINLADGDPQTLGEPCGYALFKPSRQGRTDVSEEQVLSAITRAAPPTALLREVMEALEAAKTMTDLGGCPQKLDEALTWVENDNLARGKVDNALAKLREQLGEQG